MTANQKRTRKKTPEYTEAQKIAAVTTLKIHNGLTQAGMQAVRDALNPHVSSGTMLTWIRKYGDQIDRSDKTLATGYVDLPTVVAETKATILRRMQSIAEKIIEATESDNSIKEATLQQRFVVVGIIYDKLEKMLGLTPEKIQAWSTFDDECKLSGLDSIETINDYKDTIRDKRLEAARKNTDYVDI